MGAKGILGSDKLGEADRTELEAGEAVPWGGLVPLTLVTWGPSMSDLFCNCLCELLRR